MRVSVLVVSLTFLFTLSAHAQLTTAVLQGGGGIQGDSTTTSGPPGNDPAGESETTYKVGASGRADATLILAPRNETDSEGNRTGTGVAVGTILQGSTGKSYQGMVGIGYGGILQGLPVKIMAVGGVTSFKTTKSGTLPMAGLDMSFAFPLSKNKEGHWLFLANMGGAVVDTNTAKQVVTPGYSATAAPYGGLVYVRGFIGYQALDNVAIGLYASVTGEIVSQQIEDLRGPKPETVSGGSTRASGDGGLQGVVHF